METLIPKALRVGDTIALIAPAGPSSIQDIEAGKAYLQTLGFVPKLMPNASQCLPYLAGDDSSRLADLHEAFRDPSIHGILCLRGGYGTMRLLDKMDWRVVQDNPKVFIGFSDLTSFLIPAYQRTGLVGFHGPMLTSNLIDPDPNNQYTREQLWPMVTGKLAFPYTVKSTTPYQCLNSGEAQGVLMGGNLSLLAALSGTAYQPDTEGCILFIEDWRESPYKVDRKWTQLALAGYFDHIVGLLLCDFTEMLQMDQGQSLKGLFSFLAESVLERNPACPIGIGFSVGHGVQTATLPIGLPARFVAESGHLEILSSPVLPD
jgi:muramoyltetrapeptide carboxypeptidase